MKMWVVVLLLFKFDTGGTSFEVFQRKLGIHSPLVTWCYCCCCIQVDVLRTRYEQRLHRLGLRENQGLSECWIFMNGLLRACAWAIIVFFLIRIRVLRENEDLSLVIFILKKHALRSWYGCLRESLIIFISLCFILNLNLYMRLTLLSLFFGLSSHLLSHILDALPFQYDHFRRRILYDLKVL